MFMGNLHPDTGEREIEELLLPYGPLADAPLVRRNFGFAQFIRRADAQAAMQGANGTVINGMAISKFVVLLRGVIREVGFASRLFFFFLLAPHAWAHVPMRPPVS